MKRFLSVFLLAFLLMVGQNSYASKSAPYTTLKDSAGTIMTAYTFSTAKTTSAIPVSDNVGFASLIVDVTSGTIDSITYQISYDGLTWYTPYTTDGTSLTSAGSVVTDDITATRWIVLTARLAPFMRFTFTPTGSTVISVKFVWQDDS